MAESETSTKSLKKQEEPSPTSDKKSIRQLITESGFHWDIDRHPAPTGPRVEQNVEILKFKETLEQAHLKDSRSHRSFWTLHRRRRLREVSVRVFSAGLLASIILAAFTFIWYFHFNHIYNLYLVPKNNFSASASEKPVYLETTFLSGVKRAEWAFDHYAYGLLFLTIGSICANYARRRPFAHRIWWYLAAILLTAGAIVCFVLAPMVPLFAKNDDRELEMFEKFDDDGEYAAYQLGVKGSLDFFRNVQCKDTEKSTKGKDEETKIRMKFFCEMISRLTFFFYFMWVSSLLPLLILVLSFLEVMTNAKSWIMKAQYRYKKRTAEQIEADKSTSLQAIVKTNIELLY